MYCYCNYKLKIKNKEELKMKRTSFYFLFLLSIYIYVGYTFLEQHSNKSIVIKDGKVQDSLQERGEKQFDRSRFTQGWLKFTLRTVERLQSLHNLLNGSQTNDEDAVHRERCLCNLPAIPLSGWSAIGQKFMLVTLALLPSMNYCCLRKIDSNDFGRAFVFT